MRSLFLSLFFCLFPLLLQASPTVLVSIAPQKYLVEKIAEDTVSVQVVVPTGASPHSYEPAPSQTITLQKGEVWFQIGEAFEYKLRGALKKVLSIDQREGIDLIGSSCSCHSPLSFCDVHIWLSPKNLILMASQIEEVLSNNYPAHADLYKKNLQRLLVELGELDSKVAALLQPLQNKAVLVSHPAFAYLCRDYRIRQVSIEMEGGEPTAKYLADLFAWAKKENIKTVFLQKQYNVKGGKKIAKDLGAQTVYLDPYAENVIENIERIAKAFYSA